MQNLNLFRTKRREAASFMAALVCFLWAAGLAPTLQAVAADPEFSFVAAGDMREFVGPAPAGKRYFDGLCENLQRIGPGEFMVTPGDADPPGPVRATLDRYLGTNFPWYPVIGNHETEKKATMAWLRRWAEAGIPHLVRRGPTGAVDTIYSFDFANAHFIALDEYFDGKTSKARQAGLPNPALTWLEEDLAATRQPLIFVVGHKPIQSLPDMDTGRRRHATDSISTNAAQLEYVIQVLKKYPVRAYICGHTHDSSVAKVKGLWQVDTGHARGAGDPGSPSTFVKFRVQGTRAWADVYRADLSGQNYKLRKTTELE
jgi:hypothetical protein